jgi:hypothetical protein
MHTPWEQMPGLMPYWSESYKREWERLLDRYDDICRTYAATPRWRWLRRYDLTLERRELNMRRWREVADQDARDRLLREVADVRV